MLIVWHFCYGVFVKLSSFQKSSSSSDGDSSSTIDQLFEKDLINFQDFGMGVMGFRNYEMGKSKNWILTGKNEDLLQQHFVWVLILILILFVFGICVDFD